MNDKDIADLCAYARHFSRLNEDKIAILHGNYSLIQPCIPKVTDAFYDHLHTIPKTLPFIEGRLESLKQTHQDWVDELFTSSFDEVYTRKIYHVGDVHVKIRLPVEFMAGAMVIIQSELLKECHVVFNEKQKELVEITDAIGSAIGFSLLIMQESFQSSTLVKELENFLNITGMSRTLFNNLAKAYKGI